jgi:hypothetical protein
MHHNRSTIFAVAAERAKYDRIETIFFFDVHARSRDIVAQPQHLPGEEYAVPALA